jgi:sulfide dehydrogenase cytochrome subunit
MKKLSGLVAAGLMIAGTTSFANPNLKYDPQAMAWLCAPCHGTDGREFNESMPALAGMNEAYFIKTMIDFREGRRATVIMDRVAHGFNDEEIKAMAAWFAKQPATQWNSEINYD